MLNSTAVLRLNICAKPNICASNSASSQSPKPLEDEFDKFDTRYLPDDAYFSYAKNFFKSYITDTEFREIIENKKFALLNTNPNGDVFRKLPPELRTIIPEYIKDNVSLNRFMA